ncbi:double-strand break repair helicase AddA [Silicimonas sp. MF1-12-2]|uniref:double-strand break repair helicase AddA n=1 Tax=Silicimonas sp. MF1-12-2 TaxID=3384793 RepID=UPI0039B4E893
MIDDATQAQIDAADPRFSTWLSANAGSGKTRVLTDRVARLLLAGTEPQNILCLTYTKAAASEMQNRLFKRLGEWAMLDDDALRQQLRDLGEAPPENLTLPRTLFARAIEAPGGLKILTIHSFCSTILRQFPLEAGVSPQFRELDESGQTALIDEVLDQLALDDDPSLGAISRISSDQTLTDLARSIAKNRAHFRPPLSHDAIFRRFEIDPSTGIEDILAGAFDITDLKFLKDVARVLATSEKSTDQGLAQKLAGLPDEPSETTLGILEGCFLFSHSAKSPFGAKIGTLPTKAFRDGPFQPYHDRFNDIMAQIESACRQRRALNAAKKASALHDFASAFLPSYDRAKETAGVLDFDDLIQKVGDLLSDRSLEWVLYRLDGGIEHILVDEAQDTSPQQWDVIDSLAREITAGEGAQVNRTIFVVGDKKQSIYSFQGADARVFDQMQSTFTARLANGPTLMSRELHFSFRSSEAILSSVDSVFDAEAGRELDRNMLHRAFHTELPGRVDLWPLAPKPEMALKPEWYEPVDQTAADDPKVVLADMIAKTIKEMIGTETIPGEKGIPRRVRAGDFLILVQGRGALFDNIIRACKALQLPMAGADRLKIGGELAVRDLLALLSFLALQEDDLSLAAALRSPLFGWSEKQLYGLAHGRKQSYLWAELRDRKDEFPETFDQMNALLRQVDFLRPYELLELILTQYGGREKLLARLGSEAEDGIDELLNQALAFERDSVPSLTGFLTRAQSDDIEIKRQSDASGDLIRVMTVHGAKGLESPIVILPDTTRSEKGQSDPVLLDADNTPLWRISAEARPDTMRDAAEIDSELARQERQRLLYVAMTRAETWLIVCGAENERTANKGWYVDVREGMEKLAPAPLDTPTGAGLRVSRGIWPTSPPEDEREQVTDIGKLPDFLRKPAPDSDPKEKILSPSDMGGDKALGGGAREEEAALKHGRQIHRLLEFLPSSEHSTEAAYRILASGEDPIDEADVPPLLEEAIGVINAHPRLFSGEALAEVDVGALLPTIQARISGTIDRLVIEPERVTVIDFKTNPVVPASEDDVPEGLLRQMGAYLEAVEQIFPGREIELNILWTKTAGISGLSHGIVRQALARHTTS